MEIILVGLILWYLGRVLTSVGKSAESMIDYWEEKEKARIAREYKDDCEY